MRRRMSIALFEIVIAVGFLALLAYALLPFVRHGIRAILQWIS